MELQALHQELTNTEEARPTLKCINGTLYRDGKLLLTQDSLKAKIIGGIPTAHPMVEMEACRDL